MKINTNGILNQGQGVKHRKTAMTKTIPIEGTDNIRNHWHSKTEKMGNIDLSREHQSIL